MTIHRSRKASEGEAAENQGFVIDSSRTLSFDLLRASTDHREPRIAYFYRQENRPEDMVDSNDRYFLGAAILKVVDDNTHEGDYMTNQAWLKGLNAAGTVRLERISES